MSSMFGLQAPASSKQQVKGPTPSVAHLAYFGTATKYAKCATKRVGPLPRCLLPAGAWLPIVEESEPPS